MPAKAPGSETRRRRSQLRLWHVAVLGLVALLPLRFYLSEAQDDARFAWRMFSRGSAVRCDGGFERGGVAVDVAAEVGDGWRYALSRGDRTVIDELVAHLCRDGAPVAVAYACWDIDGRAWTIGAEGEDACR